MGDYSRIGSSFQDLGYNQQTATSKAQSLTAKTTFTIPVEAVEVSIQPEDGNIRWRNAAAPTANTGNIIYLGDTNTIPGPIKTIEIIRVSGDAVTNLNFWGYKT